MTLLYLDASSIIYLVEAKSPFYEKAHARICRHLVNPEARCLTSLLSRLECRVRPLRSADTKLLDRYDAFFSADVDVIDIDAEIIDRATDLRARYHLKTPDALHVATALAQRASAILTGDSDLSRCKEIAVEILDTL